jgi:hypothetical protein
MGLACLVLVLFNFFSCWWIEMQVTSGLREKLGKVWLSILYNTVSYVITPLKIPVLFHLVIRIRLSYNRVQQLRKKGCIDTALPVLSFKLSGDGSWKIYQPDEHIINVLIRLYLQGRCCIIYKLLFWPGRRFPLVFRLSYWNINKVAAERDVQCYSQCLCAFVCTVYVHINRS